MINELIFQELTDAEAANLTGGQTFTVPPGTTLTSDGEGGFFGTVTLPDGTTGEIEVEGPEGPELEDQLPGTTPTTPAVPVV